MTPSEVSPLPSLEIEVFVICSKRKRNLKTWLQRLLRNPSSVCLNNDWLSKPRDPFWKISSCRWHLAAEQVQVWNDSLLISSLLSPAIEVFVICSKRKKNYEDEILGNLTSSSLKWLPLSLSSEMSSLPLSLLFDLLMFMSLYFVQRKKKKDHDINLLKLTILILYTFKSLSEESNSRN